MRSRKVFRTRQAGSDHRKRGTSLGLFLEHHTYCSQVIKFVNASSGTPEVTAVDRGILELKIAVANLSTQVDQVTTKIDS